MNRVRNWDTNLTLWVKEKLGQEFVWGENDCGTLTLQGIAVMYGDGMVDVPEWNTKFGAMKVLKGLDIERALIESGAEKIGHRYITTGDVLVAWDVDDFPALSIMFSTRKALLALEDEKIQQIDKREFIATYPLTTAYRF